MIFRTLLIPPLLPKTQEEVLPPREAGLEEEVSRVEVLAVVVEEAGNFKNLTF